MLDGKLKLTFEAGEVVVVSVNAGLDLAYQRLFESAREQLRQREPPIEAGIQLIVFGCFWLEAICNEALRDLIRGSMKPSAAAEAAWDTFKRAPFHAKFLTLSAFTKAPDAPRFDAIARDLTELFGLRNRLAHFKDEDARVAGPLTFDELLTRFDHFPDADLLAQLSPPTTERWALVVLDAIGWVTEISQQYFPSTVHPAETPEPDARAAENEPSNNGVQPTGARVARSSRCPRPLAIMDTKHSPLECADCGSPLDPGRDTAESRAPCPQCGSIKRAYFATMGNAQPSNYLLDNYIAHKLSELTQCHAPKLKDDHKWLNTFILNNVFRIQLPAKTRAYVFNFLRRTEGATSAYRAALSEIHEYLNTPRNVNSPYFRALSHIEICIAQCYQDYELLARASGESIYTQGDGSPEERLRIVYVDSKHMDHMIAGDKLPEEATAGIWITNTGVASARGALTFAELHGILCNMRSLAERLSALGPSPNGTSE